MIHLMEYCGWNFCQRSTCQWIRINFIDSEFRLFKSRVWSRRPICSKNQLQYAWTHFCFHFNWLFCKCVEYVDWVDELTEWMNWIAFRIHFSLLKCHWHHRIMGKKRCHCFWQTSKHLFPCKFILIRLIAFSYHEY